MRYLILSAILLASAGCAQQPQAPVLAPRWGNLEGHWRFQTDPRDQGQARGWQRADFDDSAWRSLEAPGYWEPQGITDPRPGQPPRPRGNMPYTDYDGVAWYRLRFTVPAGWAGQDLILALGSVDDFDRVWLNGTLVGETPEGIDRAVLLRRRYTLPAQAARFGEANVLAIRVFDGGGPGGIMGPTLSLLPRDIEEAGVMLPQDDRSLAERFMDPPASCRILKIVHAQPDSPEQQDEHIKELVSLGFGGMATNVSFDGYVESEPKWQAFLSAIRKAKDAGMCLWLYDELGYPSGTAGGIVMRGRPEWEARGLLVADRRVDSPGPVELGLPPGKLVMATALPVTDAGASLDGQIDLSAHISGTALNWTAPGGSWHVMLVTEDRLYEGTHAAVSLHENKPYINLLMAEPTQRFIAVTHQAYADRLGADLSPWFSATFTDEPSLMSRFFRRMPYRPLPWSPGFAGEFKARHQYDILPLVPLLIADGPGARKARYDFWETVAHLVSENYFGLIQTWCREHGIASGGHLLLEEPLCDHVAFYGDLLKCTRKLDAPSIDCLTSIPPEVPWRVARMAASAAELNGNELTMCETSDHSQRWRPQGDTRPVREVSEEEIRGTCNRLILSGINTITSYYSFAGMDTAAMRRLNDCVGRACTMLRGGHQVADIAVLYPVESVWPVFRPATSGPTDAAAAKIAEETFNAACEALFRNQRDFTFIDSGTLAAAESTDGALHWRDLAWRVIVLPSVDTLPIEAWRGLSRFVKSGGAVIALASLPANSESEFPCAEVQALSRELFGKGVGARVHVSASGGVAIYLPRGSEGLLPMVLASVLEPDVTPSEPGAPLRMAHRRIDGHEVFFIINDSAAPWSGSVTICAEGPGELWDPATGEMTHLAGPRAQLDLAAYSGAFLRFAKPRQPKRLAMQSGALPGLEIADLPASQPTVGCGEFVRSEFALDDNAAPKSWRAVGRLTKSDVDTHLFVSFRYAEPADLSDAEALVIDSTVPAGQQTSASLLVILTDADGEQYLGSTTRPLSEPGAQTSYVPFTAFHLAGFGPKKDGELDRAHVSAISIGWGGYFGEEGESVEFQVAAPRIARVK